MQRRLKSALSIEDLRKSAQRRLPKSVFDFIDGGAEDEATLQYNRTAFDRWRLIPRVLQDVSAPDVGMNLHGQPLAAPLVVAPMGSCSLGWPQADIAIAQAAASLGIPYTLSTMSTTSIERMARAVNGPLWFQLYVLKNHGFNHQLMERAWKAGYQTLVVTVDLPAGGKRERDLRNGIQVPFKFNGRHLWAGMTHPHWAWQMLSAGLPEYENVKGYLNDHSAGMTIAARVGQNLDAQFAWTDLEQLRQRWHGKLWVKGVAHPDDAARLVALGVDGIWVSNHGGRQLDGAVASLDALPLIAQVVAGKVPLILDSGVRRGVDVLKAQVLGAQAVAVGRAALWGACVAGQEGAQHALNILIDELKLAMKLAGTPHLQAVSGLQMKSIHH
jgi:L-lactate dehydrogenase (cytochrome)/(S)-mandelate dehydrogenase